MSLIPAGGGLHHARAHGWEIIRYALDSTRSAKESPWSGRPRSCAARLGRVLRWFWQGLAGTF